MRTKNPDGIMHAFVNMITGEVVFMCDKPSAIRYFKADGKAVGYKVRRKDILSYKEYLARC